MFLSFFIMISSFFMTSCMSMEEIAYHDEYVIGTVSYPVYYINSYPYYWFDNSWIMIPRYRYTYIRHIDVPRHIHAYRPNPHNYMYRPSTNYRFERRPGDYRGHRPNNGVPHTRQPNIGNETHRSNTNNYTGGGRVSGRR